MRALLVLLLAALPLRAGVVYEFTTTIEQPRASETVSGRVWIDGERYRADVVRADGKRHSVISRDGDRTAFFLDLQKQTWSNRVRVGEVRSGSLFLWPVAGAKVRGRVDVTYKRATEPVTIAGEAAVEHVIEARFRVTSHYDDAPVRGEYRVTARIWTAEALPPLPAQNPLRTGYPQVDRELDEVSKKVQGLVLRNDLEVVRALEGGPPLIEKTRATVTKLEQLPIADEVFAVPESFAYAGPDAGKR